MKMTVDYLTGLSGDPAELRQVFSMFPSGVVTVAALNHKGEPVGMVASSFTSVSLDPPLVSICIQNTSATWPALHASKRLGISVMTQEQKTLCRTLARKDGDRFEGVDWQTADGSAVFISGSAAWLECTIHNEFKAGDHTIVLLDVCAANISLDALPLLFFRSSFRALAPDPA